MRSESSRASYVVVLVGIALLAGCAPATARPQQPQNQPDAATRAPYLDHALRIAITNEAPAIAGKFGGGTSGTAEYADLFAAKLARLDYLGQPVAQLAAELPSIERGTWTLLDDGTMETIYSLRPALQWQDGYAFTADDVVFTWQTILRPDLPATSREPERFIEDMEAVSPTTLRIRWHTSYIYANVYDTVPLPRHILEPILANGDPRAFTNSDYWTTGWVGLGPYRLVGWIPGSYVKGAAFTGYALGTPRISEILLYFIDDANQAIARMVAGDIDLTVGSLLKLEEGQVLKEQLEARREGSIVTTPGSARQVRVGMFQFRPPQQPPGRDVRLRKALTYAVDRQEIVENLQFGMTKPADMFLTPVDAMFAESDRALTKYPYDQSQALRLFAEANWTRGPDGVLRDAGGESLKLGLRSDNNGPAVKELQVLAQFWQGVGVDPELEFYTRAQQNDTQYRATFPGFALESPSTGPSAMLGYASQSIPAESNRWRGTNRGGYASPDVDGVIGQYFSAVDAPKRSGLMADFWRLVSADVPAIPLYYKVDVFGVRAGLQGVEPAHAGDGWTTFNAHLLNWTR